MICSNMIWRDVRGGILVFFIVCLPVMVGAVGYVVDLTRAQTLQTQLQRVADAAALAAAKQMDFRVDALSRAEAAALALANNPSFAASSAGPQIITPITFYSAIVNTDDPAITADVETSLGANARFVRVTTTMRTSSAWFVKLIGGGDAQVNAVAWAQSSIQACGVAPLFFCVNKGFKPVRGTQVKLKAASSNQSTYLPGNFGLLDPPGVSQGVGAKLIDAEPRRIGAEFLPHLVEHCENRPGRRSGGERRQCPFRHLQVRRQRRSERLSAGPQCHQGDVRHRQ